MAVDVNFEESKVLMVRHSCHWKPDRCSRWLQCQGCQLDYVCPARGEPLPDPGNYAATIVFGGVQSANDCDHCDWMREELDWIEQFITLQRPLLGICLGAQLIARTLGARVERHPEYKEEIGFRPIYPVQEDSAFVLPGQLMFQWHNEGFELPVGAQLLARGDQFPNQAFSFAGHVTGLQFHPEANYEVIKCWQAAHQADRECPRSIKVRKEQLNQAKQLNDSITQWLERFLANWYVGAS